MSGAVDPDDEFFLPGKLFRGEGLDDPDLRDAELEAMLEELEAMKMGAEGFFQIDLIRYESDISDFVFLIPEIDLVNDYRLTVARDRAFKSIMFQLDGVKDTAESTVTFTPAAADVAENNISERNKVSYFMVQEMSAGSPVGSVGYGRIKWQFSPD